MLPPGWRLARLGEIAVEGPTNGYSPATGPDAQGTRSLKLSATTAGYFILSADTIKPLYETIPEDSWAWLEPGDLLVQRANTAELVGTAAIYDGPPKEYIYPDLMMRLRFADEATTRWVWRYMNSPHGRRFFDRMATGAAGSMPKISGAKLRDMQIPLPPLPEQRRIADILDKADAIRRKRKDAIALTEELLRSAFLDMVGPGAADYGTWNVRSVGSLAASRPNSMRTGPFGSDLLHSEFADEGVAVLGIDNAVQNRFAWGERRFVTPEKYERLRRYTVFPGDVIVTIMGTTGRSAVVPDDIPTAITTKHLATITLDRSQAEPEFVSQALFRHPEVLSQIAASNRGAIMHGLNLGLVKSLLLPIPPLERQRKFAETTMRIRAMTRQLEIARETANDFFASLVYRAFQPKEVN
ncbi:restriction endonuclease subunit S [Pyxidicoccus xibeiensis]|uniref:restriction endonuclease subunit S n=1 Tax=Pyxidicoccus xibeiensis TaxID=2906759 RepID=UPI0020A7AD78|nr:restriction endonuclease subunit S [Pyxidicoccus xibeiensis]MCP3143429.1 restriction endonuclease subunit S [Pyxidicoccus xibeiensis]